MNHTLFLRGLAAQCSNIALVDNEVILSGVGFGSEKTFWRGVRFFFLGGVGVVASSFCEVLELFCVESDASKTDSHFVGSLNIQL